MTDSAGNITGWTYVTAQSGESERYDASGKLLSISTRTGITQRLTYSDGTTNDTSAGRMQIDAPVCSSLYPGAVLPAGRLLCVTDSWGHQFQFKYDSQARIVKMVDPANQEYAYAYDGPSGGCATASTTNPACTANNLTQVTYPDGKSKTYHYNEAAHINGGTICPLATAIGNGFGTLPNQLTGITDENGVRYASWSYDCQGRAISSEHAGGIEKVTLAYGAPDANGVSSTTVTHILGDAVNPQTTVRSYKYQTILGVAKNLSINQPCAECGDTKTRTYDVNGNITSRTDWNNNQTTYTYDLTRNLETSRTEAAGTSQARTITTAWHPTYRLPLKIAEPNRRTTFTHDANGNVLTKTVQATTDATGAQAFSSALTGAADKWAYTYKAVGQVLTIDGPRTDATDKITYAYDTSGNLATITNAAGHVTTLSNYDAHGHAGRIVDPNGIATTLTHHPRGWLASSTVTDGTAIETTTYAYDGVGQLTGVTLPKGTKILYTYDDAHRLTAIADSLGNKITYTLDNMGNRINEQVKDPGGTPARQTSRLYDALNRLQQVTGGAQ